MPEHRSEREPVMHSLLESYLAETGAKLSPLPAKRREEEMHEMRSHLENAVIVNCELRQMLSISSSVQKWLVLLLGCRHGNMEAGVQFCRICAASALSRRNPVTGTRVVEQAHGNLTRSQVTALSLRKERVCLRHYFISKRSFGVRCFTLPLHPRTAQHPSRPGSRSRRR